MTAPWPIIVRSSPSRSLVFPQAEIIQLPTVWECFLPEALADFASEEKKYQQTLRTYQKELHDWDERQRQVNSATQSSSQPSRKTPTNRKGKKPLHDPKPAAPVPPQPRMQADEVPMFLALATALKLYLGRQVTDDSIDRASSLFYDYLLTYRRVSNNYPDDLLLTRICSSTGRRP
jgi:hypothetical protein